MERPSLQRSLPMPYLGSPPDMHLLCTLGSSFAVVPEAFLLGNNAKGYTHVTVVTTSGTTEAVTACKDWFATHQSGVSLRILDIDGLPDIRNAHDHAQFEEALFRATFHAAASAGGFDQLDICLAGGFKTISSATHQVADLLGCRRLFHITAPFGERFDDDTAIREGIRSGQINLVDLGTRPGWPTIRALTDEAPPPASPFVIENTRLRDLVLARLREANQLSQSEPELASLPFPQVARWSPASRAWLNEPLRPETDQDWIQSLPKLDLHCHLGGFATHGESLKIVRRAAEFPDKLPPVSDACEPPDSWPCPDTPIGLEAYRKLGDNNGSGLLRDPGCLRVHISELYAHFISENIHYAEVRCSPANYASAGRSAWLVLSEIRDQFELLRESATEAGQPAPLVNLIIIATRQQSGDFRTHISRHLALAATAAEHWTDPSGTRVVGVDLAGFEDSTTRAHYFRDDFTAALRLGLGITIHAGENDDAEGIWSAILDLNARRLGHALHLATSPTLIRTVADRRIGIEMCPFANLQIIGFPLDPAPESPDAYPLLTYLEAGVPVTVNTDNIGISAASLGRNFLLLPRLCPGIRRIDILRLIRNSIDQAFLDTSTRRRLLAESNIPRPA